MSTLAFIKVQGLGNDFLLLDRRRASVSEVDAELIQLSASPLRSVTGGEG